MALKVPKSTVQKKTSQCKEDANQGQVQTMLCVYFDLFFFVFNLFHFRHANITAPKMGLVNIGLESTGLQ